MSNDGTDKTGPPMIHSLTRLIDKIISDGAGYDTLTNVLALFCLISILNRGGGQILGALPPAVPSQPAVPTAGSLQKILGDLVKNDGSNPSPDALMSLLPLMNNPQVKSKLNPTTMAAILGLMNNFGNSGSDKTDSPKQEKPEKQEKAEKQEKNKPEKQPGKSEATKEPKNETPAAAVTALITESSPVNINQALASTSPGKTTPEEAERKGLGRYLNWKSHF